MEKRVNNAIENVKWSQIQFGRFVSNSGAMII